MLPDSRCTGFAKGEAWPWPLDLRCGEMDDIEFAAGTCGGTKSGNS